MRPATLAMIGTALGAAAGHAFRAPFRMGGILDLIAYHDPGFHTVIRVWYTRPRPSSSSLPGACASRSGGCGFSRPQGAAAEAG